MGFVAALTTGKLSKLTCGLELTFANEQRQDAPGDNEAGSDRQDGLEALDGAQGHDPCLPGKVLGAGGDYIDIRQCKGTANFLQEDGFLLIRFNQREVNLRRPDFNGNAREAGAGAYVDNAIVSCRSWLVSRGLVVGHRRGE